jgi:hypothetical protein
MKDLVFLFFSTQVIAPLTSFRFLNSPTKQTLLKHKGTPPTGYAVWRTKIRKVCKRLFITYGFAKPFLSGHIPQKFSDNYSILTTTKPACSVELATNNQPRQHSNFGCFNFCNLSGGLTRHQSCGIAAQPHNGINETAKQIVALYVSSICWIHLEGGFTWFYNHLWSRCTPKSSRAFAAGYAPQKNP